MNPISQQEYGAKPYFPASERGRSVHMLRRKTIPSLWGGAPPLSGGAQGLNLTTIPPPFLTSICLIYFLKSTNIFNLTASRQ